MTDAKNNHPKLVHPVKADEDIHISQHSKPVTALLSKKRYQRLSQPVNGVFLAIMEWREQHGGIDLTDEEVDSWRDTSEPRDF